MACNMLAVAGAKVAIMPDQNILIAALAQGKTGLRIVSVWKDTIRLQNARGETVYIELDSVVGETSQAELDKIAALVDQARRLTLLKIVAAGRKASDLRQAQNAASISIEIDL